MPTFVIDAAWNRKHASRYNDARLAALYDRPMALAEVLTRQDGAWAQVSHQDRIWVATRLDVAQTWNWREWMARILDRLAAAKLLIDPRSLAVAPLLRDPKATDEAWEAAAEGARAAWAEWAAWAARVAGAAEVAARAAWAAGDAEQTAQMRDLIELVTKGSLA